MRRPRAAACTKRLAREFSFGKSGGGAVPLPVDFEIPMSSAHPRSQPPVLRSLGTHDRPRRCKVLLPGGGRDPHARLIAWTARIEYARPVGTAVYDPRFLHACMLG